MSGHDGKAPVLAACGLVFEAQVAAGPGVLTACGPGPGRVAAQLDALLAGRRCAGIISFGCAGALDRRLRPGSCVVATGVLSANGFIAADPEWRDALLACLPQASAGELAGLDAPLASAAGKALLWRDSGASAVDMESHAAALAARRHGLRFAACRVVLDPAWRSLPFSALAALREDGGVDPLLLARGLVRAPRELGPLCLLAREAWLARRSLKRVRARLGPAFSLPGW